MRVSKLVLETVLDVKDEGAGRREGMTYQDNADE